MLLVGVGLLGAFSIAKGADNGNPDDHVYTLYTNAPSQPSVRFGMATFDLNSGEWNQMHCHKVAELLQVKYEKEVAGIKWPGKELVRHWCEKGRFNK